tara:strand:+ start:3550 stop:3876 length:327 start_codon:yes stop_codon:yes gene_type:complete
MAYYGKNAVQAWVEFNGSTDAIRESHNISSISDQGTSDYDINFTTNFADANYVVFGSTVGGDGGYHSYICSDGSDKSVGTAPVRLRHAENHANAGETDHLGIAFVGNQ